MTRTDADRLTTTNEEMPAALAAVIDIGSNAMRLRIGGLGADGQLKLLYSQREAVRLGKDAFTSGQISEATISQGEAAFVRFREAINRYPVAQVRATGTSALRSSVNHEEVIRRIAAASGIQVELISGEEEARLVHVAIRHAFPAFDHKKALLIDIGGGSVEVSLSEQGDIVALESFKMGTVRMLERFSDAPDEASLARLVEEYAGFMQRKVREEILDARVDVCIGTGGNIECIGELIVQLLDGDSASEVSYQQVKQLGKLLRGMSYAERVEQLQLRPDRADVIIPALIVLRSVMKLVKPASLAIPATGLAEGVLIDLLQRKQGTTELALRQQAISWATAMARRFHADLAHAQHVAALAMMLFDRLHEVHGLSARDRLLLHIAALVHEIGIMIRSDGHHRHAAYILRATPMIGLDPEEKELLACVVRFQRKKMPSSSHEYVQSLGKEQQQRLLPLVVLLRMAMAMNKERNGDVDDVTLRIDKKKIVLFLQGRGDLLLERWALHKQLSHASKVFGRDMHVSLNG